MQAMHRVLLRALHQHGLLKGRKTGIDSSINQANASPHGSSAAASSAKNM